MIVIEETIKHCEEEAERIERNHPYIDASEYRQLAEWLRRLKHLEDCIKDGNLIGCINCKYDYLDIDDYPCRECCRECRKQYWEGKEDVKS